MRRDEFQSNVSTARELITFVWHSKNWWLTPIIVVVLLAGGLLVLLESSAVAPFIYALF
jgi:uncharacterized protein DUF5989